MAYPINSAVKIFEAVYIATNERLNLNVDMAGESYYRNIHYDEIQAVTLSDEALDITFQIGTFTLKDFDYIDAQKMMGYIENF